MVRNLALALNLKRSGSADKLNPRDNWDTASTPNGAIYRLGGVKLAMRRKDALSRGNPSNQYWIKPAAVTLASRVVLVALLNGIILVVSPVDNRLIHVLVIETARYMRGI